MRCQFVVDTDRSKNIVVTIGNGFVVNGLKGDGLVLKEEESLILIRLCRILGPDFEKMEVAHSFGRVAKIQSLTKAIETKALKRAFS